MTRELLQQALDALHELDSCSIGYASQWFDADRLYPAISAISAHMATPATCEWTEDDEMWETSCGEAWGFPLGGPVENGVRFCHGCGKPVEIEVAK